MQLHGATRAWPRVSTNGAQGNAGACARKKPAEAIWWSWLALLHSI